MRVTHDNYRGLDVPCTPLDLVWKRNLWKSSVFEKLQSIALHNMTRESIMYEGGMPQGTGRMCLKETKEVQLIIREAAGLSIILRSLRCIPVRNHHILPPVTLLTLSLATASCCFLLLQLLLPPLLSFPSKTSPTSLSPLSRDCTSPASGS